jgi:Spy/CpxP family protein refolding chaperone
MKKGIAVAFVAALSIPQLAMAQELDRNLESQLARYLFAPGMVMRYERQLDLTDEQRATVSQKARELQSTVLDLQFELEYATQGLVELASGQVVDLDAAMQQIDKVLDLEANIKRTHLRALIEIRNTLSADQQETLKQIMIDLLGREKGAGSGGL